jgi:hypothetical protein
MDPRRTICLSLVLASSMLLVIGVMGCSRDPHNAAELGKKIDLTLPKPTGRADTPQKQGDKSEAAATNQQTQVGTALSTVKGDLTKSASNKSSAAPVSAQKKKVEPGKKTYKRREAAADSLQKRQPVGDGATAKEEQDSRSSRDSELYEQSDNPLHPSYKKK